MYMRVSKFVLRGTVWQCMNVLEGGRLNESAGMEVSSELRLCLDVAELQ